MAYPLSLKNRAIQIRKSGYSIKEVAHTLKIAQSTSSLWLRDTTLDQQALTRIQSRKEMGHYNASLYWQKQSQEKSLVDLQKAHKLLGKLVLSTTHYKLLLAILFWTEGSKNTKVISFINSDPKMITSFIKLMRVCYSVDENKFRALLHAHEYHDIPKQILYWNKITNIPLTQFSKTYLKPHTKKRKKTNYPGCLRIRYYDATIARELTAIYNAFGETI